MVSDIQREGLIATLIAKYMQELKALQEQLAGGGQEAGPDPVVALKEKELELRAQQDQAKLQLEQAKLQQAAQIQQQRIQSQEKIAQDRVEVARERAVMMNEQIQGAQRNAAQERPQ
jgi:hypothetical protein